MKTDYGIRALTDLAERHGQGPVRSASIASRQGIPEPFLDQLMTTLRRAGIVQSARGPQGGHQLARSPSDITMMQVVLALEGSLAPIECLEHPVCPKGTRCAQREVWQEVQAQVERVLGATTIGELADRERRSQESLMYHI
jgi:Rrf2 family protein